ncbi:MAG TPA: Gfo/Idh/MocA family oxidoreductase [Pirellulales bacterium]|nr:Gfo/Idh/MocA family oxidoreductase [Pirellulales bacterium]
MSDFSRRKFITTAGTALAATTLIGKQARADANSTLRIAVIGVNGRGRSHIAEFSKLPGVELAVFCDPDQRVAQARAAEFEKSNGRKVEIESDMRKVFDRKDIDICTIATPNHWHSLATIWACQAGKDVYVEKPGSHNIFEGRKMVEAAKKYNRIVQHGVQLRSSPAIREGVEHLRNGTIGEVYMARGLVFRRRASIDKKQPEQAPDYLNWDLWQGPAQEREFSRRYVHYNWHWHWDFGNGDVGNQGIHETDMCQWGLDVQLPKEVVAMGGKFLWDDDKETPEVLTSCYKYPDQNKLIQFEVRHWHTNSEQGVGVGNIFYGSEGILVVDGYSSYRIYDDKGKEGPSRRDDSDAMGYHVANFIEAVRSRKTEDQNGPVESAHYSSALAHLGNIAYRTGRQLQFDPAAEKFVGDDEANKMLTREYRAPYVVPESV